MLRALLLLALMAPHTAAAQPADTLRHALLAAYTGDLSFNSFNGGSLSLKRERSPVHALRFGLDAELTGFAQDDASDSEDESQQLPEGFESGTIISDDIRRQSSTIRIDLVVEVERYAVRAGRMRPYGVFGVFGGPRFHRSEDEQRQVAINEQRPTNQDPFRDTQVHVTERTNKSHAWGGGVAGGLGVEWRLARDLSLLAEYRSSLFYERSVSKNVFARETTYSNSLNTNATITASTDRSRFVTTNYGFRSLGLRVGAALYF